MIWSSDLFNVWQSAAEHYWCSRQQVDKATDSVRAYYGYIEHLLWASDKTKK